MVSLVAATVANRLSAHIFSRLPQFLVGGLLLGASISAVGCLEAPSVGAAARPDQAKGPAPMQSTTSNAELKKKVTIMTDLLDGKLQVADLQARLDREYSDVDPTSRQEQVEGLKKLMASFPPSVKIGEKVPEGPLRQSLFGFLYFEERRFIEASVHFSKALDADPRYPGARNYLARCFYFLGNPHRTIQELEWLLTDDVQSKNRDEVLDALYLIGAAVDATPGIGTDYLQKGAASWSKYLELVPDSPERDRLNKGIGEMRDALEGRGRLAVSLKDAARQQESVHGGGGGGGGGGGAGGSADGAGGAGVRTAALAANASDLDKAIAAGLDALDAKDWSAAEPNLVNALKQKAGDPELLVGLARVYVQTGRIEEAMKMFGEVQQKNPDYMPALHYQGMAYMLSGNAKGAAETWQKILDKDPAYAQKNNLERRIQAAKQMAGQ